MLVLTRHTLQTVRIGREGEILVKVLKSKDGEVKLGFEAPADIPIDREEIFWSKHKKRVLDKKPVAAHEPD